MKKIIYFTLAIMLSLLPFCPVNASEEDTDEEEINLLDEEYITRDEDGNIIGITVNGTYLDISEMSEESIRTFDSEGNIKSDDIDTEKAGVPIDVDDEYSEEELEELESGVIVQENSIEDTDNENVSEDKSINDENKESEDSKNSDISTAEVKMRTYAFVIIFSVIGIIGATIGFIIYFKRKI